MKNNLCDYNLIVTTPLDKEEIAASYVEELDGIESIYVKPMGFKGLLLVKCKEPNVCAENILKHVSFVERVYVSIECTKADPEYIARTVRVLASNIVKPGDSFAVRTIRRGTHAFTSIDVNVIVGREVQLATSANVDLEHPDYVIYVNIIDKWAFISLEKGVVERPKRWKEKPQLYKFLNSLIIVQEPYLSKDPKACFKMGERIGRAVQTYEIGDYYIALTKPAEARLLSKFIEGVNEGIESRYGIQKKSYARSPLKTRVHVYEMHLLIRQFRNHPVIVFEPEGDFIADMRGRLRSLVNIKKRPVLVFGAREGVPKGLFRFADFVIDVAPGMTLSTDQVIPAAIGSLITILYGEGDSNGEDSINTGGR